MSEFKGQLVLPIALVQRKRVLDRWLELRGVDDDRLRSRLHLGLSYIETTEEMREPQSHLLYLSEQFFNFRGAQADLAQHEVLARTPPLSQVPANVHHMMSLSDSNLTLHHQHQQQHQQQQQQRSDLVRLASHTSLRSDTSPSLMMHPKQMVAKAAATIEAPPIPPPPSYPAPPRPPSSSFGYILGGVPNDLAPSPPGSAAAYMSPWDGDLATAAAVDDEVSSRATMPMLIPAPTSPRGEPLSPPDRHGSMSESRVPLQLLPPPKDSGANAHLALVGSPPNGSGPQRPMLPPKFPMPYEMRPAAYLSQRFGLGISSLLCFTVVESLLWGGDQLGNIHVWDIVRGKQLQCFKAHTEPVLDLVNDGFKVWSCAEDIAIWNGKVRSGHSMLGSV